MREAGERGLLKLETAEDLTGWDGWKGYEFWSSQLEARESLAEYAGGVSGKIRFDQAACGQRERLNDALPF